MQDLIKSAIRGGGFESVKEFELDLLNHSNPLANEFCAAVQKVCNELALCYNCGARLFYTWDKEDNIHYLRCNCNG